MGITMIPIGIQLQKIHVLFGCKNQQLFDQLLISTAYSKYDESFSFKRELTDIFFNYIPVQNREPKPSKLFGLIKGNDGRGLYGDWQDYAFALLVMCIHHGCPFGELLKNNEFDEEWDEFSKHIYKSKPGFDTTILLKSQHVFDTPFKQEEVNTAYLREAELHHFKMSLENASQLQQENKNKYFLLYKHAVENCLSNELEMVVFSFEEPED